jgi:hypothetical protein
MYLQEARMRRLSRDEAAAIDRITLNRARAPETTKFADLLWALAESHFDRKKYEAIGMIAGTVQGWADKGHNLGAPEVLIVLEAVIKAQGAL